MEVNGEAPALELRGITKRFGPVVANDGIDFDLRPGEVHALLGENGAGKSTLMSILYGMYRPDEGEIRVKGEPVAVDSPATAIELGIGMVHQHFMLVPVMTVTENIVLGGEPRSRGGLIDRREGARRVSELAERYGLAVDPGAVIEDVTVAGQQRVEILKTLYREARILVLDEPTAVLTPQETAELFAVLRALRDDGVAIVFISHKLGEVLEIADRVTVLRRGKRVDTVPAEGATEQSLARLMVGRDVLLRVEKADTRPGQPALEVEDLQVRDDRELEAVRGVSLTVREGEIVALAGVEGNGQQELVEAIAGLRAPEAGRIAVGGREVSGSGVRAASDAGLAHIAEDRQLRGLVLDFTLAENLALREYHKAPLSRGGWLAVGQINSRARSLLEEYDVRGGGPEALAGLALGRQPAEGLRGARDRQQPEAAGRASAHPRPRRRRDRVRPPAAGRRARQGARHPARLARVRGGARAGRPHPGDLRGAHRRRVPARCVGGGAGRGDDGGGRGRNAA